MCIQDNIQGFLFKKNNLEMSYESPWILKVNSKIYEARVCL